MEKRHGARSWAAWPRLWRLAGAAHLLRPCKASGESWRITKAKLFAAQIERRSIDVSPLDWFPAIAIWDRLSLPIAKITKGDRAREVNAKMLPGWVTKEWDAGNAAWQKGSDPSI